MANLFSISRFFLAILFLILILNDQKFLGVATLLIAALTDFIDGQIARRFDQVTDFGTLIDPIADRFLVITVVVTLLFKFWQPIYITAAALLFFRELIIGFGFIWFKTKRIKLEVSVLGKISTALVFSAFVVTFIFPKQGIYFLFPAIGLYYIAAFGYFIEAWRQLVKEN